MVYLNHSITRVHEFDTFRATVYCLSDIARAIGPDFKDYIGILDFYIKFINVLNNN